MVLTIRNYTEYLNTAFKCYKCKIYLLVLPVVLSPGGNQRALSTVNVPSIIILGTHLMNWKEVADLLTAGSNPDKRIHR